MLILELIVLPFVLLGQLIAVMFRWICSLTENWLVAIGTILVAVFTIVLAWDSHRQWQTMQDTLNYQIEQTRSRLAVRDLVVADFPNSPYVTFCVENDGHSMADQAWVEYLFGGFNGAQPFGPPPTKETAPVQTDPNGFALGEGKSECRFHQNLYLSPPLPTPADIAASKPHTGLWIQIKVSYRDAVTKKADATAGCIRWNPLAKGFFTCIAQTSNK